jgi:hypothetical protein
MNTKTSASRKGLGKGKTVLVVALATAMLAGCGGGGSDSAAVDTNSGSSPEGAYSGTLTNSSATNFSALLLDDGQVWALYGNLSGGTLFVSGFTQGQGTWKNGTYTANGVKDFGEYPAPTGNLSLNFVAGQSISGSVSTSTGSVGLTGTAIPQTTFAYGSPASVADVAGNWAMNSTGGSTLAINVSNSGVFTGADDVGCTFTGTMAPRAGGKRVLNVQMTFGGAPCALPGATVAGIGLYSTPVVGKTQLIVAVVDGARTIGSVAFGSR